APLRAVVSSAGMAGAAGGGDGGGRPLEAAGASVPGAAGGGRCQSGMTKGRNDWRDAVTRAACDGVDSSSPRRAATDRPRPPPTRRANAPGDPGSPAPASAAASGGGEAAGKAPAAPRSAPE